MPDAANVTPLDARRGPRLNSIKHILRELEHVYRQRWRGKMTVEELNARTFTLQTMLSAHRALMGQKDPDPPWLLRGVRPINPNA